MAAIRVSDEEKLRYVMCTLIGIPTAAFSNRTNPLTKALYQAGVTTFETGLLGLAQEDIMQLQVHSEDGTPIPMEQQVNISAKRMLCAVVSFFHYASRNMSGAINITTVTKAKFDGYRTNIYDPNDRIVPWSQSIKHDDEIINWDKSVKISRSDYKEFHDESLWFRAKDRFETTVESQGLESVITDGAVVTNPDLDARKRKWMYKVMQDIFIAPFAKSVVLKHSGDKDTRAIWKEICQHYDGSMASEIRSQALSTYLTSTRLDKLQWRGSLANFLLHWQEQARTYNEISPDPYSESQLVTFLNACVSGVEGLSQVLTLNRTAKSAAGVPTTIEFSEFLELLISHAQVIDSNRVATNRNRRSVNAHEISDPDGYDYESFGIQSNVHDFDTQNTDDTGITAMVSEIPRDSKKTRPVRLDISTWKSLSAKDQEGWDSVSEDGKLKILSYGANNPGRYKATKTQANPTQRRVNVHDLTFDDSPNEGTESTIEIMTHESHVPKIQSPKTVHDPPKIQTPNPNNGKTVQIHPSAATGPSSNRELSINSILSTKPKGIIKNNQGTPPTTNTLEAMSHESTVRRSPFTLESYGHEMFNVFELLQDMRTNAQDDEDEEIGNGQVVNLDGIQVENHDMDDGANSNQVDTSHDTTYSFDRVYNFDDIGLNEQDDEPEGMIELDDGDDEDDDDDIDLLNYMKGISLNDKEISDISESQATPTSTTTRVDWLSPLSVLDGIQEEPDDSTTFSSTQAETGRPPKTSTPSSSSKRVTAKLVQLNPDKTVRMADFPSVKFKDRIVPTPDGTGHVAYDSMGKIIGRGRLFEKPRRIISESELKSFEGVAIGPRQRIFHTRSERSPSPARVHEELSPGRTHHYSYFYNEDDASDISCSIYLADGGKPVSSGVSMKPDPDTTLKEELLGLSDEEYAALTIRVNQKDDVGHTHTTKAFGFDEVELNSSGSTETPSYAEILKSSTSPPASTPTTTVKLTQLTPKGEKKKSKKKKKKAPGNPIVDGICSMLSPSNYRHTPSSSSSSSPDQSVPTTGQTEPDFRDAGSD